MSTKPPSGSGLAAESVEDSIETILLEASEKPLSNPLPPPASAPVAFTPPPMLASTDGDSSAPETPFPITLEETPALVVTKTPLPALKTPAPTLKTPGPVAAGQRDPNSVLPTIPAPRKEPSGAFPLPGMAPPEGNKDDDVTLIARLSVLDELVEESTKVEPLEAALRAAATKDEPIALADQASAERDRALAAVSAADRVSAAEFEDPGDDEDELTVSATPGIISIADEDDDEEETTASQRPQNARPVTPAPLLPDPPSLPALSAPRLPAPTPPPGRTIKLPTPSAGLPPLPVPLSNGSSGPQRSVTPALPISAPLGAPVAAPSTGTTVHAAIFKLVHLPRGGLALFGATAFAAGLLIGAVGINRTDAPAPVATEAPASQPAPAAAKPEEAPAAPAAAAAPAAPAAEPAPAPAAAAAEPKPAPEPAAPEPAAAPEEPKPIRHAAAPKAKVVHKPVAAAAEPPAAKPTPAPAAKPVAAAKPAAAAKPTPAAKSVASAKPAKGGDKGKKTWVDPFAE